MVYSRVMQTIKDLEEGQVAPTMARVNAILDHVRDVSARMTEETARVDQSTKWRH